MVGLVCSIVFYEYIVFPSIQNTEKLFIETKETERVTILHHAYNQNILILAVFATTVISIIFMVARESIKKIWVKRYKNFEERSVDSLNNYNDLIITNS